MVEEPSLEPMDRRSHYALEAAASMAQNALLQKVRSYILERTEDALLREALDAALQDAWLSGRQVYLAERLLHARADATLTIELDDPNVTRFEAKLQLKEGERLLLRDQAPGDTLVSIMGEDRGHAVLLLERNRQPTAWARFRALWRRKRPRA